MARAREAGRAGAARRQAGRHRLDHAGVRRRLPRPRVPARCRRGDGQPVPRRRLARPVRRHRATPRRRRLRARADLQQGGSRGAARRRAPTAVRSPAPSSTGCAGSTRASSRSAPSARWWAPTIGATEEDLDVNGPLLAPGYGAQGGTAADLRRIFGAAARARAPEHLARGAAARPGPARRWPTPAAGPATSSRRRSGETARSRSLLAAPLLLAGCGEPSAEEVRTDYCEDGGRAAAGAERPAGRPVADSPARGAADLPRPRRGGAARHRRRLGRAARRDRRARRGAGRRPASTPRRTTRRSRPSDLTEEQRDAIERAAAELLNPPTEEAVAAVDQQARDVCRTPLFQ